jgi:hypothetical protein
MAALLINDVRNDKANACPKKQLRNPWDLFKVRGRGRMDGVMGQAMTSW